MLIWRIGINDIPTRANLQRRLQHVDPTCILCNLGDETSIHLFFECHFTRTLWASACWGLRIDASLLNSNEDIIKLIMAPPNSPMPIQEQWTISFNMAIIIDEIWKTRNLMLFQEGKADPIKARQHIQAKFLEITKVFSPAIQPPLVQITAN